MESLGLYRMRDDLFLRFVYEKIFGKPINLHSPQTYCEKLQWIKLYDHNSDYTRMVDKEAVKEYVASKIGAEYIIPTYGVWERYEDIEYDLLPEKFVLKCTHDSGGIVIVRDKENFDSVAAKEKISRSLERNYYYLGREWPYRDVKHKVLAEQYMEDSTYGGALDDYKVLCFEGEPKLIEVHRGRGTQRHTQDFYNTKWELTEIQQIGEVNSTNPLPRPELLEEMLDLSRVLCANIHHVRVDWYIVDNKLYFGELTFFDASGLCPFIDNESDYLLGSWINLDKEKPDNGGH